MKIGTFTAPSAPASSACARAGSVSATRRISCQLWKAWRRSFVSRALIVTRNISRPSADAPAVSTDIRPPLRAAIESSVQPIA